ncbi:MAG: Flp pilus assembly complex ATPase component TadA [Armatimonadetes bacterium]|nr:Flp pilus assembly complex ATPase component TadA [Armatimonadota bacterium]
MQTLHRTRLGDMLVIAGILSNEQLEWALDSQRHNYQRLGDILLGAKFVSEDDITEARALQLDMPYVELNNPQIRQDVIKLVPEHIARTYNLIPISASQSKITIAMDNPMDVEAIDTVGRCSKRRVTPVLAGASRIQSALDHVYGTGGEDIIASIEEAIGDVEVQSEADLSDDLAEERRQSTQAPVVKTVNLVLQEAVKQRASDIHFEPRANNLEIRYRLDGALQHIRNLPKQLQPAILSRIKIMADMDIAEKRLPQDGRIKVKIANKRIELRISSLPTQYGERIVIRIFDRAAQQLTIESLGMADQQQEVFDRLIRKPHGIILVTGPTGSGKTTTLYSALNEIRSTETNIMTCEDPIEYELEGISQSQINVRAGLTFASQLRAILRQDPDIILVGEIRDKETAEVAFQAAMTGHLVFSTLHCNDAPSAITRLIDMGVEPYLIGSSVIGVLAQRLVRTLCPRCKVPYTPTPDELAVISQVAQDADAQFYAPSSCGACNDRGYSGRMAVFELMAVDEDIRRLTLSSPTSDQVRELALTKGMKTMNDHAAEKIRAGLTCVDEVRRKVFIGDDA